MPQDGLRVLVADDERSIRFALLAYLAACGHQVMVAADAGEAGELLADFPFDAIVLDLRLGDRARDDCWPLLAEARRLRPQSLIVVLTAYANAEVETAARRLGADVVLAKPQPLLAIHELLVGAVVGRSRA